MAFQDAYDFELNGDVFTWPGASGGEQGASKQLASSLNQIVSTCKGYSCKRTEIKGGSMSEPEKMGSKRAACTFMLIIAAPAAQCLHHSCSKWGVVYPPRCILCTSRCQRLTRAEAAETDDGLIYVAGAQKQGRLRVSGRLHVQTADVLCIPYIHMYK